MNYGWLHLLDSQLPRLSLSTKSLAYLYILKDWRDVLVVVIIGLSVAKTFSVYYCISLHVHSERLM